MTGANLVKPIDHLARALDLLACVRMACEALDQVEGVPLVVVLSEAECSVRRAKIDLDELHKRPNSRAAA